MRRFSDGVLILVLMLVGWMSVTQYFFLDSWRVERTAVRDRLELLQTVNTDRLSGIQTELVELRSEVKLLHEYQAIVVELHPSQAVRDRMRKLRAGGP